MEEKEKKVVEEEVKDEDEDILDPDDFDEEDDEEEAEGEGDSKTSEEEPSKAEEEEESEKEKNAKAAERRRKREKAKKEREAREAKIREEATVKAELGILKVNPYTEEPIEDAEDLKIYKLQKELEDEGLDPINDLPKRLAQNARRAAKEEAEKLEKEQKDEKDFKERVNREVAELQKKYPKVNLAELAKDELFKECLNGRAGRWTQVEIYELYLQKKAETDKKEEENKAEEIAKEGAKKVSNPPSSTARGSSPQKTVEEMTPEEYEVYFRNKYNA